MNLVDISRDLRRAVDRLRFSPPVTHVYNPLDYAREPHEEYLRRYGTPPKEVVLVGMNPGPFGMAQTGVPFGEVSMVRDWMGIDGKVRHPKHEHDKRPVMGFDCHRSEVSGARLWGWARDRFGSPDRFFERFFILNYCPLVFMEESGRNRTPDKLPKAEREPLQEICDRALHRCLEVLEPRFAVGVGAFAEKSLRKVCADMDVTVGYVLHPSPASPKANQGWAEVAEQQLRALGVTL